MIRKFLSQNIIKLHSFRNNCMKTNQNENSNSFIPNLKRSDSTEPKWIIDLVKAAETDPEIKKVLESTNGDQEAIRSKMREKIRPKLHDIIGENSGDLTTPKVSFRLLKDFSNIWIWVQFKAYPSDSEKENFEEAIKAFFITGKLGGFNSINLQIFYSGETDFSFFHYCNKDADETIPAFLHELGKIEFKGKWARFYLDMGTCDELSLDILVNLLIGFSKEFSTFSHIVFGGENTDWKRPRQTSRMELLWREMRETGTKSIP